MVLAAGEPAGTIMAAAGRVKRPAAKLRRAPGGGRRAAGRAYGTGTASGLAGAVSIEKVK
jgi:hypothetical protein